MQEVAEKLMFRLAVRPAERKRLGLWREGAAQVFVKQSAVAVAAAHEDYSLVGAHTLFETVAAPIRWVLSTRFATAWGVTAVLFCFFCSAAIQELLATSDNWTQIITLLALYALASISLWIGVSISIEKWLFVQVITTFEFLVISAAEAVAIFCRYGILIPQQHQRINDSPARFGVLLSIGISGGISILVGCTLVDVVPLMRWHKQLRVGVFSVVLIFFLWQAVHFTFIVPQDVDQEICFPKLSNVNALCTSFRSITSASVGEVNVFLVRFLYRAIRYPTRSAFIQAELQREELLDSVQLAEARRQASSRFEEDDDDDDDDDEQGDDDEEEEDEQQEQQQEPAEMEEEDVNGKDQDENGDDRHDKSSRQGLQAAGRKKSKKKLKRKTSRKKSRRGKKRKKKKQFKKSQSRMIKTGARIRTSAGFLGDLSSEDEPDEVMERSSVVAPDQVERGLATMGDFAARQTTRHLNFKNGSNNSGLNNEFSSVSAPMTSSGGSQAFENLEDRPVIAGWYRLTVVKEHLMWAAWQPALGSWAYRSPWFAACRSITFSKYVVWWSVLVAALSVLSFSATEWALDSDGAYSEVYIALFFVLCFASTILLYCCIAVMVVPKLVKRLSRVFDWWIMVLSNALFTGMNILLLRSGPRADSEIGRSDNRYLTAIALQILTFPLIPLATMIDAVDFFSLTARRVVIAVLVVWLMWAFLDQAFFLDPLIDRDLCFPFSSVCETARAVTLSCILQMLLFAGKFLYSLIVHPDGTLYLEAPLSFEVYLQHEGQPAPRQEKLPADHVELPKGKGFGYGGSVPLVTADSATSLPDTDTPQPVSSIELASSE